jgi:hypothetical protein
MQALSHLRDSLTAPKKDIARAQRATYGRAAMIGSAPRILARAGDNVISWCQQ